MPETLSGGVRLALASPAWPARRGKGPARSAGVVPVAGTGALRIGKVGRAGGVAPAIGVGALRIGKVWRAAAVGGVVRRGHLRIAKRAAPTAAQWRGEVGQSIVVAFRARRVAVGVLRHMQGPGQSAGAIVQPLPAVWLAQTWPAEYIGRELAALAILRGEPWALDGTYLNVAGRVVVGEGGIEVVFESADDAAGWVMGRMADLAGYLGVIALPAGWREDLVSRHRVRAGAAVKRGAAAAKKVADGPQKMALLADLTWIQRRI